MCVYFFLRGGTRLGTKGRTLLITASQVKSGRFCFRMGMCDLMIGLDSVRGKAMKERHFLPSLTVAVEDSRNKPKLVVFDALIANSSRNIDRSH